MKAPDFWFAKPGLISLALAPAGWLWALGAILREKKSKDAYRAPIPVICIGNVVAGGQGKTPLALCLVSQIAGAHFLSSGYGGTEQGPLLVDPKKHDYTMVGDEPLLLAQKAPCWVSKDRAAGIRKAVEAGARCVIMDDGFQDPSIVKDVSLLVVDGIMGFGSGRCIPAGPLREPLSRALRRAAGVVLMGKDEWGVAIAIGDKPLLRASIAPDAEPGAWVSKKLAAFAGIGRPQKFFQTLTEMGAKLVKTHFFPDHHPYSGQEIEAMIKDAKRRDAILITTTKDFVRVPENLRKGIAVLPVSIVWDDPASLPSLLACELKS